MTNHYAVLGVGPTADGDALRQAYRARARTLHPDRGGDRVAFQRLREAYDTLRDPVRRRTYARELAEFLRRERGVLCPQCGEANHVPPDAVRGCHVCDADLPRRERTPQDAIGEVGDRLRARAAALTERAGGHLVGVGDRLAGQVSDLLIDGVDAGIGALRRRLGLDPRGRR